MGVAFYGLVVVGFGHVPRAHVHVRVHALHYAVKSLNNHNVFAHQLLTYFIITVLL